ncbi:MAG TPA: hypothetical protein V6D19_05350 [Stenomitos sp.]
MEPLSKPESESKQPVAFAVRNGCENAIDAGGAEIYIVPDQPVTVKAFYNHKELAAWLVRYGANAETTKEADVIVTCEGDITDGT